MNHDAGTEARSAATENIDGLPTVGIVGQLIESQAVAASAVRAAATDMSDVADAIVQRLRAGGRLHYAGAGTSGRLAALDAAEMPPTFGTPTDLVRAHIAGGAPALTRAVEGAEDDGDAGERDASHVRARDAAVGISASGGAEYVVRFLRAARARGAYAAAIVNLDGSRLSDVADRTIVLRTGAEAIAGSTRLTAGTAQKIALNTMSTAVMIRLGKVYGNLMVDVAPTNRKLRARAVALVGSLAHVDDTLAAALLEGANGSVKVAVVMQLCETDAATAGRLLAERDGVLRSVIG